MDDAQYLFVTDSAEKKKVARSARNRVNKKKGCTLPSDYLTAGEKKKMNGDVMTVNLNQKMSYRYFKTLTPQLQEMYLNHLVNHYKFNVSQIKKSLGCTNGKTLEQYIEKRGINVKFKKYARGSATDIFEKFMNGELEPDKKEKEETEMTKKEAEEEMTGETIADAAEDVETIDIPEPEEQEEKVVSPVYMNLQFKNVGSMEELAKALLAFPLSGPFNVRIDFDTEVEEKSIPWQSFVSCK